MSTRCHDEKDDPQETARHLRRLATRGLRTPRADLICRSSHQLFRWMPIRAMPSNHDDVREY